MSEKKPVTPGRKASSKRSSKKRAVDVFAQQQPTMPQPQIHPLSPEPQTAARDFDEKNPYYAVLNMVIDPELGVGIADMGLIYRVQEHDGVVVVTMTLTSMGCPAGPQLTEDIDSVLRMQKDVKDVEIEVVWEPAWNPEMMNPQIRQMLFGGP